MSEMVPVTEAERSRSHDGTNLEGGRCDGSEEGGGTGGEEDPAQSTKKAPAKAKATTSKSSKNSKKATPTPKKAAIPTKTATKKTTPAAKKATPVQPGRGGQEEPAAAAKKAAPKKAAPAKAATPVTAKKKTAPAKAAVDRRRPSGRRSGPTPRTPSSSTSSGPAARGARHLQGQAVDLRAEADSLALEREPGDVQFDEESGEGGTVTVDRERNLALSAQASAAVEEIDDALRKIERKTYGGCERCHQAIPKARLRALPFARLCVACKSGGLSRR